MATAARVYRPSVFMHLQIRLEDFSKDQDPTLPSSDVPYPVKLRNQANRVAKTQAELTKTSTAPGSVDKAAVSTLRKRLRTERAVLKQIQSQSPDAVAQQKGAGDAFSIDLYLVPLDWSVDMNSFRIADTMQATFPFIDAPFLSQIIRAAVVEVWAGTVTPEDFAAPDRWRLRRNRSSILFRGWVDSWDTTHDDTDAKVQITCRSYESILMDAKINPRAPVYKIKGGKEKISAYLNRILSQFPATSGGSGEGQLRAAWYGADPKTEPELSRNTLNRSLQTAASRNAAGSRDTQTITADVPDPGGTPPESSVGPTTTGDSRMPPKSMGGMQGSEMSVWDLFTQACQLAGCLPTYDPSLPPTAAVPNPGNFILLRPPQTLFEDISEGYKIQGGASDGFERRFNLPTGKQITSQVRFLVWGHNIKTMKTSRKLGHVKVTAVEVISYNDDAPAGKRTISVRYPSTKFVTHLLAKGEAQSNEVLTINVQGIRDEKMLLQVAVGVYHQISRQELSVSIETNDLASYIDPSTGLAHNDEMDMLRLRPGSPCRVAVARQVQTPADNQTLVISPLSEVFEQRDDVIFKLLQDQNERFSTTNTGFFAGTKANEMQQRISAALASAKLVDTFYCRTIQHRGTEEDGWSCTMELVNFLTARALPRVLSKQDQETDSMRKVQKIVKTAMAKNDEANKRAAARATDALRNRR